MSLVLSRKEQESIVIFTGTNEQVLITVERFSGGAVKLSFDAPDSVDVWREELLEAEGP